MSDLYTLFQDLTDESAAAAAARLQQFVRAPGETVVEEGDARDAMLFIESGSVAVTVGGFEVAKLSDGALLGEIGLFAHAVRTATVTALTQVTLQSLSRADFLALRQERHPITPRIERRALNQLVRRHRDLVTDLRSVARGEGSAPTASGELTILDVPASVIADLVRRVPVLADGPVDAVEALTTGWTAQELTGGQLIASEGFGAGGLALLVDGQIDATTRTDTGMTTVAEPAPGDLFDLVPLVDSGPRDVTYSTADGCRLLFMPAASVTRLLYADDLVGSTLRIGFIRTLADRVNQLNAAANLARLLDPEADPAVAGSVAPRAGALAMQTTEPAPLVSPDSRPSASAAVTNQWVLPQHAPNSENDR